MFANPAFDNRRYNLGRAGHIDLALGIARRPDLFCQLRPETVIRETDDTGAVNGTVKVPCKAGEQGIGLGPTTEERYIDAAAIVLVDKHADMNPSAKGIGQPDWGIQTSRNKRTHRR